MKTAKEIKEKVNNGEDFALAKQYSEDTGSKEQGGKYLVLPWTNSERI